MAHNPGHEGPVEDNLPRPGEGDSSFDNVEATQPADQPVFDPGETENIDGTLDFLGPSEDWVPFADRPEFRQLALRENFDFASRNRHGQDAPTPLPEGATSDPVEATNRLKSMMLGFNYGLYDEDDITTEFGEEAAFELFGGLGQQGFQTSGLTAGMLNGPLQDGTWLAPLAPTINQFAGQTQNTRIAAYLSLTDAERTTWDNTLWLAGYNEGPPGDRGDNFQAFVNFSLDQTDHFDVSFNDHMNTRISQRFAAQREPDLGVDEFGNVRQASQRVRNIQLSDPEVVKEGIRQYAVGYTGRSADEDGIAAIASEVLAKEDSTQRAFHEAADRALIAEEDQAKKAESDIFYQGITQAMGGTEFAIRANLWPEIARMMTGDAHLENTPDNQRNVIDRFVAQIYGETGSWDSTTRAFHTLFGAGGRNLVPESPVDVAPGDVRDKTPAHLASPDAPRNLPTHLRNLDRGKPTHLGAAEPWRRTIDQDRFTTDVLLGMQDAEDAYFERSAASGTTYNVTHNFDSGLEAERLFRARNRAAGQAWQYSERADQFFDFMGQQSSI